MYCIALYIYYHLVSVPQPCPYPILTPYATTAFALVAPECERALAAPLLGTYLDGCLVLLFINVTYVFVN